MSTSASRSKIERFFRFVIVPGSAASTASAGAAEDFFDRRYVTAPASEADFILRHADADLPIASIGHTGGDALVFDTDAVPLAALRQAHEGWLPGYMG